MNLKTILPWLAAWIASINLGSHAATPSLLITNLPAYGSLNPLAGLVLNGDPARQAVAVFIYVPGFGWVSKPTCAQPLSPIRSNGAWSANITTGGASDATATRVAALLVGTNYSQACVLGLPNLPADLYASAIAKKVVTRPSPGVRFLSFSGYDWTVKNAAAPVGPGPNYFSDSTSNVWTDANGWLHLRLTHRSNAWQCAEITSARTFGPGSYRFELGSPVDTLDPGVTLGLFTYSDDPAFTNREIDVECSRWGNPADTNNSQFVVQPYYAPNQLVRYRVPAGLGQSTHLFVWETNRIRYQSQSNTFSATATNLIAAWNFTNAAAVPQSGDENVHLNLWLQFGNPPTDNQEVEIIIKSFNYVPLGTPPPAILTNPRAATAGGFQCGVTLQPDYRYKAQSAENFLNWTSLATVLATNGTFSFADTNLPAAGQRFYRFVTLP